MKSGGRGDWRSRSHGLNLVRCRAVHRAARLVIATILVVALACISPTQAGEGPRACPNPSGEWLSYGCVRVNGILRRPDGSPLVRMSMSMTFPQQPPPPFWPNTTYGFTDDLGRFYLKWDFLLQSFITSRFADGDSVPVHLTASDPRAATGVFDSLDIKLRFTPDGRVPPQDTLRWVTSRAP